MAGSMPAAMCAAGFPHLLSPGRLGALETRNRLVLSPMGSNLARTDGHVSEGLLRYYEERARGGAGLLVVGVAAVDWPRGASNPNQVAISDDAFLPGLRALTERVHVHGARIAVQLQHAGRVATRDIVAGRPLLVPSRLPHAPGDLFADLTPEELERATGPYRASGAGLHFHEMGPDDIERAKDCFVEASARAQRAGFDGIELHAGHGYLLSAFLSPSTNRRSDAWGGPLENRARLLLDTLRAVRARVGPGVSVWCRLDGKEFRKPNGITPGDAARCAVLCEEAGADAVHVSAYADPASAIAFTDAPLVHEPGGFVALAETVKRSVGVPVIAVGRIEPEEAERLVAEGRADFVAMARKLLADPELPNKLAAGTPERVRPCIYGYRCVGNIFLNGPSRCVVNPASGREAELELAPAARPGRVVVAGGGPSGLEAARLAARRGHRVVLLESAPEVGGLLRVAARIDAPLARLLDWLVDELARLDVEVRTGTEATLEAVEALVPDAAIVAIGGEREPAFAAEAGAPTPLAGLAPILEEPSRLGERVAIVGGDLVATKLAERWAAIGCDVCLVAESAPLAPEMAPPRRWRALHALRERGVVLHLGVAIEHVGPRSVRFRNGAGESRSVSADAVLRVGAASARDGLAEALADRGIRVRRVGECAGHPYVEGSLESALRAVREL